MNFQVLEDTIKLIDNKDHYIYFYTVDTLGNPLASIEYLYRAALELSKNYKVKIIYEPPKDQAFVGVREWLGDEMADLPHMSSKDISDDDFQLTTADVVVIGELYSDLMENLKDIPCHKIILSQSWGNILEFMGNNVTNSDEYFNTRWDNTYKIADVITTSEKQKEYIKGLFPSTQIKIIEPPITEEFKNMDKLKKPIVAIMSRYKKDTDKIVKAFYTKYPLYKWVAFKNMKGLPKDKFAKELSECCLAVWVDNESSFGTFPLEAIACNVPCMGLIPDMMPDWMLNGKDLRNNGIWVRSRHDMHTYIAEYITAWLKDDIPSDLTENKDEYYKKLTTANFNKNITKVFTEFINDRKKVIEDALENTKQIEEVKA